VSKKQLAVKSIRMRAWCVCGNENVIVEKQIPRSYATEYFQYRTEDEKEIDTGNSMGFGRPLTRQSIRAILSKHLKAAESELIKTARAHGTAKCHND
jgi:hypothetical protein